MRKLSLLDLQRKTPEEYQAADKHPIVIVVDNVRSKTNIGSIFRNADAYLVEKIFICGYSPTPPNREITKTALGAELTVPWEQRADALSTVQELKAQGYRIASVEQAEGSTLLSDFHLGSDQKLALVLGNEVAGVQQEIIDASDLCLEIPMFGTKHSFNVAVATGIILYGVVSQKA